MSDERKDEEIQAQPGAEQPLNTAFADGLKDLEAQAAQIAKELQAEGDVPATDEGEQAKPEEQKKTDPEPDNDQPPTEGEPQGEPKAEGDIKPDTDPKKPETLEEQVQRLKNDLRSRDGRHGRDKEIWMAEAQTLRDQLAEAQRKLAAVNAAEIETEDKLKKAPPAPESEEIPEPTEAELKKEFGDDYADVIGADYAKRMWITMEKRSRADRRKIRELVAENAQKVEQERSAATRLDKLFADVEAECPGAGDLNAQAKVNGFGEHLDGYFGETGFTRRQMATLAIDAIKAGAAGAEYAAHQKTLVSIFKGFLSAGGAASEQPPQGTKAKTPEPKPDPKLYVQPKLAGGDGSPGKGDTITQAEAERMLDEASKKSPAEFDKVQRQISKMVAAGKIR